jgi:hypothetical protein
MKAADEKAVAIQIAIIECIQQGGTEGLIAFDKFLQEHDAEMYEVFLTAMAEIIKSRGPEFVAQTVRTLGIKVVAGTDTEAKAVTGNSNKATPV